MSQKQLARCPACLQRPAGFIGECGAGNSYSRYASTYICSDCGTREALEGFFWRSHCTSVIKPHHRKTVTIAEGSRGFRHVQTFDTEEKAKVDYDNLVALCSQRGKFYRRDRPNGVKIDKVTWCSPFEAGI